MAVALGADAVGFVFAPSTRQVTGSVVRDIVRRLPPEIVTVGVFRDQSTRFVIDTVDQIRIQVAIEAVNIVHCAYTLRGSPVRSAAQGRFVHRPW